MEKPILIVDDEISVLDMLEKVVKSASYDAVKVTSGEEALELLASNSFSMILLDINLQGIDGFQVIEKIRQDKINVPIIVISGRSGDFDTLYGLEIGADDYITKPFNPIIVGAKIKAVLRRSSDMVEVSDEITAGPFLYNTVALRLYKDGTEIPLSGKENVLMKTFMENVNTILSKDAITELMWGDSLYYDNSIMVYINRLRQKIEDVPEKPVYIRTVRGIGYKFVV